MCGGEGSVRIDPAENGFTIDTYTLGGEGKPGSHRKMIASSPEHAVSLLRPHLAKIGKKQGKRGAQVRARTSFRKRTARKKG